MDPKFPEINIPKTNTVIKPYNMEVLRKVFETELGKAANIAESGEAEKPKSSQEETKSEKNDWRYLPPCDMDLMIISSFGDKWDPSIKVVPKQQNNAIAMNGKVVAARKELEAIVDRCRGDKELFLQDVCPDFPGAQLSKDDHTDRIKQFLQKCEKGGAVIWYTGHGEKNAGNWCFKDGVITFQDIFGLYMDCFRGKRLTIVSDCSYSGTWIQDSAKLMDELGIPACGHHSRDQGILLKCFLACQHNQEATLMAFINKVELNNKGSIMFPFKELESGQTSCYSDFRSIRCSKRASESCELNDLSCKWEDRLLKGKQIYLVRGEDKDKQAWHYVQVDEDKIETFKAKVKTGTIDVADYGTVLYSGWGQYPPKDIKRKIDLKFSATVDPE